MAIKEIKREIIEQDKLEEFKNECAVMEVIRHPNIVLFLGACTKSPNLCMARGLRTMSIVRVKGSSAEQL